MPKELRMRVADAVAKIVLLEDEAPETCKKVMASLPLKGNLIHAKIAGKEFFFKAPFFCDPENPVQAQDAGNIGYYDGKPVFPIPGRNGDGAIKADLF